MAVRALVDKCRLIFFLFMRFQPPTELSWSLQTVVRDRKKEIVDGGEADLQKSKYIARRMKRALLSVEAHTSYSTS